MVNSYTDSMVDTAGYTQTMIALPQWGLWRKEKDRKGNFTKVPWCSHRRWRASSSNPETWSDFETSRANTDTEYRQAFFLAGKHVFLDFDHVSDRTQEQQSNINRLIHSLGGYSEKSQSGDGIHIIVACSNIPKYHKTRIKTPLYGDIELYSQKRFCALTGDIVQDATNVTVHWRSVCNLLGVSPEDLQGHVPVSSDSSIEYQGNRSPSMSDDVLLGKIKSSKQGEKFAALASGDMSLYADDASRAVFAFVGMLCFWTQDFEQISRIFLATPLATASKWESGKWSRLGHETVSKILATQIETYQLPREPVIQTKPPEAICNDSDTHSDTHSDTRVSIQTERQVMQAEESCPYISLVQNYYGKIEKCIFRQHCVVRNPYGDRELLPLLSVQVEQTMRRIVHKYNLGCANKDDKLKAEQIIPALTYFQGRQKGRLLVDIPEWDGRDRIKEMSACLNLKESRLRGPAVEYFLKDWCVKMWRKIYDPTVQNRVILFHGEQGIGKDEFFKTLCGGLGEYFLTPSIPRGRNVEEEQIASKAIHGGVALFDEFDRLKGAESIFKAIVTREFFFMRLPYERQPMRYAHRTSYVASTNVRNAFSDATGNRRFIFLKLKGGAQEAINWGYQTGEDAQAQLLAQMRCLAEGGQWRANEQYELLMKELLQEATPDDIEQTAIEMMEQALEDRAESEDVMWVYLGSSECKYIFERIGEELDMSEKAVRTILRETELFRRLKINGRSKRFYATRETWKLGNEHARKVLSGEYDNTDDCPF